MLASCPVLVASALAGCGAGGYTGEVMEMTYALTRQYTGQQRNALTIEVAGNAEGEYAFSVESAGAVADVEEGTLLDLTSQTVTFTYDQEGAYDVDFRVQKANGDRYLYEILSWEYSTERPTAPIISFANEYTSSLVNRLQVSDGRSSNTTDILLTGDVAANGAWQEIAIDEVTTSVTLSAGDGLKVVGGQFRNVYGNVSDDAVPAEIYLKQTPPTDCDAVPLKTIVSSNRISLELKATDPLRVFYTVLGDVSTSVDKKAFDDGEIVTVGLSPVPGPKEITVYIEDVAGNFCLEKVIALTLDPTYDSERIDVDGHTYWTDDENVDIEVSFDYFAGRQPESIKISGDVAGGNANVWLPYATRHQIQLNPTTSGSRTIYAQYKSDDGDESYLIAKRIFLKPTIRLDDAGAPFKNVVVSHILDAVSLTITGCNETYTDVAHQAAYLCEPNAATVDVTYEFPDGTTLTKSEVP